MGLVVGELVVKLLGDARQLDKTVKKAASDFDSSQKLIGDGSKNVDKSISQLTPLFAQLAAVLNATGKVAGQVGSDSTKLGGNFGQLALGTGKAQSGFSKLLSAITPVRLGLKALSLAGVDVGGRLGKVGAAFGISSAAGGLFGGTLGKILGTLGPLRAGLLALSVITAGLGFLRLRGEGIELAASFEKIEVSLRTLTGSAEGARRLLQDVEEVVLQTPFGIEELSSSARTLATVFGEDTKAVAEFTRISADLAAVSGRSVEQISSQVQRSISSGLASAEVLRETNLTGLLLEAAGATDVAELRGRRLLDAYRKLTSEGGKAFRAAADQAKTLAGAISNAGIAQQNFTREIGNAFRTSTISSANNTERAFVNLREVVQDLTPLISTFSNLFSTLGDALKTLGVGAIRALVVPLKELELGLALAQVAVVAIAAAIDGLVRGAFQLLLAAFRALTGDFDGAKQALGDLGRVLADSPVLVLLKNVFALAADAAEDLSNSVGGVARAFGFAVPKTNEFQIAQNRVAKASKEVTERTKEETESLSALQQVRAKLLGETTEDRVRALDAEIKRVKQLAVAEQDLAEQAKTLNALQRERNRLLDIERGARGNLEATIRATNADLARLGKIDPDAAARSAVDLAKAFEGTGVDPVAQIEAVAAVRQQIIDSLNKAQKAAADEEMGRQQALRDAQRDAASELEGAIRDASLAGLDGQQLELANVRALIAETERLDLASGDEELRRRRLVQLREQETQLERSLADAARERADALRQAIDRSGLSEREQALSGEIAATQALLNETRSVSLLKADEALRTTRLAQLTEKLAQLEFDRAEAARARAEADVSLPGLTAVVQAEVQTADRRAPELGARLREQLSEALAISDPTQRFAALEKLQQEIRDEIPPSISESVAQGFAESTTTGFFDTLTGRSESFALSFGKALQQSVAEGLEEALGKATTSFTDQLRAGIAGLDSVLGRVFGGGAEGKGLLGGIFGEGGFIDSKLFEGAGGLLGETAVGVIGSAITQLSQGPDVSSSVGNVRSAVDSVERVRGILAGPQEIAIAQVDRAISDAFVETNRILRLIETNTRRSAAGSALAPAGAGLDEASVLLQQSETLF